MSRAGIWVFCNLPEENKTIQSITCNILLQWYHKKKYCKALLIRLLLVFIDGTELGWTILGQFLRRGKLVEWVASVILSSLYSCITRKMAIARLFCFSFVIFNLWLMETNQKLLKIYALEFNVRMWHYFPIP